MGPPAADGGGRRIRSVAIAFDVIEALQARPGAGVTELADELGRSKSTIHSHLLTLEQRGILARGDDGYRLSLRLLDIANDVRDQFGNYEVIGEQVESLAAETGEIANFGVQERGQVMYLCKETGERAVESASRTGTGQPVHTTALGKAILAYLPDERTDAILDAVEFERRTHNTITDRGELLEELERTAERGYGIDDEENVTGLRCVAAPVRNGDEVLGAVSLSGPSSRFTLERVHNELSDDVERAANVIELNTKFSPAANG